MHFEGQARVPINDTCWNTLYVILNTMDQWMPHYSCIVVHKTIYIFLVKGVMAKLTKKKYFYGCFISELVDVIFTFHWIYIAGSSKCKFALFTVTDKFICLLLFIVIKGDR